MSDKRIGLAQINSTVGDLAGNTQKIIKYISRGKKQGADVLVFPELAITGYPPRDLLLKKDFIKKNLEKLQEIVKETHGIGVIVGCVDRVPVENQASRDISALPYQKMHYNAAAVIFNKEILGMHYKTQLPTYDVYDEKRYFLPGEDTPVFCMDGLTVGVSICEDLWVDNGPACHQIQKGAELIINISASPFYFRKGQLRRDLVSQRIKEMKIPIVYLNMVGGQDDLVFDGGSYVFNSEGQVIASCTKFTEDFIVSGVQGPEIMIQDNMFKDVHDALALGIKDYVQKSGFTKVVMGLSGGIDSAVVASIAVHALGNTNVIGVQMPSIYSSPESLKDAETLAQRLGITYKVIPIMAPYTSFLETLHDEFMGMTQDVTEENLQARIRGNILMALSNKFGWLVLSCGNKSELSIGYVTLYGDMAGGLAVLSDVPKTMVYEIARYINHKREIIPPRIIKKEPSAELREGQRDTDDIPPYEILDPILQAYIEDNKSRDEIIEMGFDKKMVAEIVQRVDHNEYKRKQIAIGIKITPRAFGFGRRMPIVNKFF